MVAAVSNAIGASNVAFRKSLDSISSVVCSSCHLFVYRGSLQIFKLVFAKSDGDISLQISLRQE